MSSTTKLNYKSARPFLHLLAAVLLVFSCHTPNALAQDSASSDTDWHYTVRPHQSIQTIGKEILDPKYSWNDLVRHNQIVDVTSIRSGSVIKVPINWLRQKPKSAQTLSVVGTVLLKKHQTTRFLPLKTKTKLNVGDEINTRDGSTLIKFADGSLLRLSENSSLIFNRLTEYGKTGMADTRLRLSKGSLSTQVEPLNKGSRFEISTPLAVAAVRGTQFRLKSDTRKTYLEVTEGEVEYKNAFTSTSVVEGQGALVKRGSTVIEKVTLPQGPTPNFNNTNITQLPADLEWNNTPGAKGYRYELYDSSKPADLLSSKSLSQPKVRLDNINNGDYLVAMRSVDRAGFEGLDTETNITIDIANEIAQLLSPTMDQVIDDDSPFFSWESFKNAQLSKLEVSLDDQFKRVVAKTPFSSDSETQVRQKLLPGRYFWRVATLSKSGQESYSEIGRFSVRGVAEKAKILTVNYVDNQVGLFWSTVQGINGYILQVSDSPDFANVITEEKLYKPSAHLRLTPGKKYYARVKGISNDLYRSDYGPSKELELKVQ